MTPSAASPRRAPASVTSDGADGGPPESLERVLGLGDLILLVVGAVIGSGIFIVPATVLRQTEGNLTLALAVWIAGGALSFLGALAYAELAAMRPESGGLYAYIRDSFGRFPSFIYGWTLFFMIGSGALATLAVAFTAYFGQFAALGPVAGKLLSLAMIAVLVVLNVMGTRKSANVQNWTTAVKLVAILVMAVALIAAGDGGSGAAPAGGLGAAPAGSVSLLSALGLAMVGVLWAYEGWQFATFSAGEVKDPQRLFPLGMAIGTATLVIVYCLAVLGYVAALGVEAAMGTDSIAATAVSSTLGPLAGRLITAAILVSIFSAANSVLLTCTRVTWAMAHDGVFFQRLGRVHPRYGTPAVSIVASGVWAMVLAATGTFDQLLTYVVFTGWIFYSLGGAALFALRRKEPDAPRPFKVPGYPVTPLLFVAAGAAVVVNAVFTQPRESLVGIAIVMAGAPAYLIWRSKGGEG